MPSDKSNLIMAKDSDLIFSLSNVTSVQEVPFGILQYVQEPHFVLPIVIILINCSNSGVHHGTVKWFYVHIPGIMH